MKSISFIVTLAIIVTMGTTATAKITTVSCADAQRLIESPNASQRPIVIDTRGGYKDYFRGHLSTSHQLNFNTLRGTDHGVPVQYLPDDLTKSLLIRAGVDRSRTHLIYATGVNFPVTRFGARAWLPTFSKNMAWMTFESWMVDWPSGKN